MAMNSLHEVLKDQIDDLMSAEKQLVKALPKMVKAATSPELREALEEHLVVTQGQVDRLTQIYEQMEEKSKSKVCKAMQGLVEEGKEVIEMKKGSLPAAIDAALIAAAQRVEHYEISAYGSARTFAEALGLEEIAALLQETLEEESEANETLNSVAASVNTEAAQAATEEENEDEELDEESDEDEEESQEDDEPGGGSRGSARKGKSSRSRG